MNTFFVVILVIGVLAGNFLLFWAIRKGGERKAAMIAAGQANGWTFEEVKDRFGTRMVFADPAQTWRLETIYSRPAQAGETRGSKITTQWTDPDLAMPEGTAVYGPPLPSKTVEMMGKFIGDGGGLGGFVMKAFAKKLGSDIEGLTVVEGRDDPATLLATPGEETVFDALIGAPELLALNAFGDNIANAPFLVRNQDGMVLRLNRRLKSAEEINDFVAVGQALAARMRG